ncbi:MAG: 3'-5' exonuclease [Candidatus Didemnitutus sp.]|nr:3'-5' exonuclease [Candidatus Didemnitutus sp.]
MGTWSDTPIHFIDFEGNRTSGILEFGVVTLRGGTIAETRMRSCAATGRVAPEDTAVHGLRAESVQGELPFVHEWEFFAALRESGPLAAHFATAENSLLKSVWPYPRTAPDFARPGRDAHEWGPWIDTGRLYPQAFPQFGEAKLERLVAAAGLQAELDLLAAAHCPPHRRRYHAALYDALAGAVLLRDLLRRPEFARATIPWLLQTSTLDSERRGAMQQGDLF